MTATTWARICCAVDFSECSRAALDQAVTLACQNGAELVLLHVLRPPTATLMAEPVSLAPAVIIQLERDLAAELERWRQSALDAGVERVSAKVLIGQSIHHNIIEYAEQQRCDAIVIGTHGRGGFKRLVLGSVAEHVVRHAAVPVVVVRPEAHAAATAAHGAP